jgi:hypothetical protein
MRDVKNMRVPKDFPGGRDSQVRFAQEAVAVIVLLGVVLYCIWALYDALMVSAAGGP